MGLFFALIFSFLIVENINKDAKKVQNIEKTIKVKTDTSKLEPIKKEIKLEPKEPEPIKEIAKVEPKEPEPIKEIAKIEPKEPKLIKEELKSVPIKEENKEIINLDKPETNWVKFALYALGSILVVITGTYFYLRQRNNPTISSTIDYSKNEFKKETQLDSTEQELAEAETETGNIEQEPTQEESKIDNLEQDPTQEESKKDNLEQEPTQEESKIDNLEQEPTQEESKIDNLEQKPVDEDDNSNKQ